MNNQILFCLSTYFEKEISIFFLVNHGSKDGTPKLDSDTPKIEGTQNNKKPNQKSDQNVIPENTQSAQNGEDNSLSTCSACCGDHAKSEFDQTSKVAKTDKKKDPLTEPASFPVDLVLNSQITAAPVTIPTVLKLDKNLFKFKKERTDSVVSEDISLFSNGCGDSSRVSNRERNSTPIPLNLNHNELNYNVASQRTVKSLNSCCEEFSISPREVKVKSEVEPERKKLRKLKKKVRVIYKTKGKKSSENSSSAESRKRDSNRDPLRLVDTSCQVSYEGQDQRNKSARDRALTYAKRLRLKEKELQKHLQKQMQQRIDRMNKIKEKINKPVFAASSLEQIELSGKEDSFVIDPENLSTNLVE